MNEYDALQEAIDAVIEDNSEANIAKMKEAWSAWLRSEECKAAHDQWLQDCGITHASQL